MSQWTKIHAVAQATERFDRPPSVWLGKVYLAVTSFCLGALLSAWASGWWGP